LAARKLKAKGIDIGKEMKKVAKVKGLELYDTAVIKHK
jgi:hypothetical protein